MSTKGKEADILKSKLSKKIAELSTVVQVLFVRNHERELELTATKKLYEDEIKRVGDEGKSKLDWLEKQLEDLERFRTLLEMKTEECERSKATVEAIQEKQVEAENKVNERGQMLSDALAEIKELKKIISAYSPEELQNLLHEKKDLANKLAEETTRLNEQKELVKDLQIKVDTIETNLNGMLKENDALRGDCSRLQEELTNATNEIGALSRSLHEARRHGEKALQRTRKLEDNNKQVITERNLLERYNKQLHEEVNKLLSEQRFRDAPFVSKKIEPVAPEHSTEIAESLHKAKMKSRPVQNEDEVQCLKKEIEKYRLELKNREINFNRVFAEKTPLIIKKDAHMAAEDLRLRNLTGLVGYKKTLTSFPSVLNDTKSGYGFHPNRRKHKDPLP